MARMVAPVYRDLPVADVARSVAFYRDVLGFDVPNDAANEVTLGPARIHFSARTHNDVTHTVFLESSDVRALREAILARGGKPSEIDAVNWIRMHAFELRDSDGHALWFGQSWHTPLSDIHIPMGRGQLRSALPSMPQSDVAAGIAHYRDVLGFSINYSQDDLGVMDRDSIKVLLVKRRDGRPGFGACYFYVRDVDALHAELLDRSAIVLSARVTQPWGLREFRIQDAEGNEITFGQPFE